MIDRLKCDYKYMVCVRCMTYNHASYVISALDGFTIQMTSWPFITCVVDDASKDDNASIIKDYVYHNFNFDNSQSYAKETNFGEILFAQHKRNKNCWFAVLFLRMNHYLKKSKNPYLTEWMDCSKYVATCEGDDYWTDPYKLQIQYDAMEKHPELDMCAHSSKMIDAITGQDCGMRITRKKECVLTVEETIMGEGGFLSTNSLFFRRELFDNIPSFRKFMDYDYSLQIQGALRGGILYLPEVMSVYRRNVPGSYSANAKNASRESRRIVVEKKKQMLRLMDQETNHAYHDTILGRFLLYDIIANNKQKDNIRSLIKNFSGLRMLPVTEQISIWAKCLCPQLVRLCQKV